MCSERFSEYYGNISVIYIDPPYNTKTKKAYRDKFSRDEWIPFMRDRLEIARKLLCKNGVIFISIDDNEYAYLKILCDDVFSEKNCVGTFITKQSQRSNSKHINTIHEYVLAYAKNKSKLNPFRVKRIDTPDGKYIIETVKNMALKAVSENGFETGVNVFRKELDKYWKENNLSWLRNYNFLTEDGDVYFPTDLSIPGKPRIVDIPEIGLHLGPLPSRGWSSDSKFIELYNSDRLIFRNGRPYAIHYLGESEDNAPSILDFYSRQGNEDMKRLGLDGVFDTPKPVEMLKYLLRITGFKNGIVLDFFAGSGSFCQAVDEINDEDGKSLSCILIQLDEDIQEGTEAYEKCLSLGIEPKITNVLIERLKRCGCEINIENFV